MKTFHTVVRTALLCSLLWIGCTALLINEYIKVVQTKDFNIMMLKSELNSSKQLNILYDDTLKMFIWKCVDKYEIRISNKSFMCHKVDKV